MAILAVETLDLDPELIDLTSTEALAASLRRAASFLCPAAPRQIVDAVLEAVEPVTTADRPTREQLGEILDLLVSTGDLLELRSVTEGYQVTRLVFLGPASYVEKEPGRYLLLGVRPYGASFLGTELMRDILYESHTRTIEMDPATAASDLASLGLHPIGRDRWATRPAQLPAADLVDEMRGQLSLAGPAGDVEGMTMLDPTASVSHYRNRWREPKLTDTGDFVARRPQAYGADLWCLVRIDAGRPQRLIDLPVHDPSGLGRDEAWRFQAAIDATIGRPQIFRIRPSAATSNSDVVIDLFSPLPSWAERFTELVGMPVQRSHGSLCSFRVPQGATPHLAALLTDVLWMRETRQGETQ